MRLRTVDGGTTRSHADHPVRRHRLRHAAVRAGMRAVRHARADEFRQSRPWRVRHGGRLHHARPGQPLGRAVLRRAAARLPGHRADRRAVRAHALRPRLQQEPSRPGAVHHRPRLHVGRRGRLRRWARSRCSSQMPSCAAGPVRHLRRRRRALPPADHRGLRAAHGRRCSSSSSSTRFGSRLRAAVDDARVARGLGINVNARVRPDLRLRLRAWPASAARSAPRFSASIRPSRSST